MLSELGAGELGAGGLSAGGAGAGGLTAGGGADTGGLSADGADTRGLRAGGADTGRLRTAGRHLFTLAGAVGVGYTLSWAAGLSINAPGPKFTATGAAIVTALAGHEGAVISQFALTEGLPAIGLAVVSLALARAARRSGAVRAARLAAIAGITAAVISAVQFVLGVTLATTSTPGAAHLLFETVNRLDGVKMLTLAVLGLAGAATAALPRWLRGTGLALAVAITVSGLVYLLLVSSMTLAAGPALILLLIFITSTGLVTGPKGR